MQPRAPGDELQVRSGVADLERVERLAERGEGGVAARIRERMQADEHAMILRVRDDVG
jgi:hypothetical protein